jgi:hypothetical protein
MSTKRITGDAKVTSRSDPRRSRISRIALASCRGAMSTDPLDRLRQMRDECDRAFGDGDVVAHGMSTAPDAEGLALRLAVNAHRQMAQARRLCEKLASSRRMKI